MRINLLFLVTLVLGNGVTAMVDAAPTVVPGATEAGNLPFEVGPFYVDGFELHTNGTRTDLYWWSGAGRCGGEFPSLGKVRVLHAIGGVAALPVADCQLHVGAGDARRVARDDNYVYYGHAGGVYRKPTSAAVTDPGILLASANGREMGALTLANGTLFWSDYDGGTVRIYRMNTDGSGLQTIHSRVAPRLRRLDAGSYQISAVERVDTLYLLYADGGLYRFDYATPGATAVRIASGVSDFAVRDERSSTGQFALFFTTVYAIVNGNQLAAVRADTGTQSIIPGTGANTLSAVAVDDQYLFVISQASVCSPFCVPVGYAVLRQLRPTRNPQTGSGWATIAFDASGSFQRFNLRSDGGQIYWASQANIMQLSTGAPAIELDFAALGLEAVQAVQNLRNAVPLVAGKPTFVRGYAKVLKNENTGLSQYYPPAALRGFLNGQELEGSPLAPIKSARVDAIGDWATLRGDLDRSYLFELPRGWAVEGSLTLKLEVDPNGTYPETGLGSGNNAFISSAIPVVSKARPRLIMVPLQGSRSTPYRPYSTAKSGAEFLAILERARSMMPVEDFDVDFRYDDVITKPVVKFDVCWALFIPYPCIRIVQRSFDWDDDKTWALIWTAAYGLLRSSPFGAPNTHWVGVLPKEETASVAGIAAARNVKLSDVLDTGELIALGALVPPLIPAIINDDIPNTILADTAIVRMDPLNLSDWRASGGGGTLAHELGHNFGRFHIDQTLSSHLCGGSKPDRPWESSYPYDACTIDHRDQNDPGTFFGFDSIGKVVIRPDSARDVMAYGYNKWPSDAYWNALLREIPAGGGGEGGSGAPNRLSPFGAGPVLYIQGLLRPSELTAELLPFLQVSEGIFNQQTVEESIAAATQLSTNFPFRFRWLDDSGSTLHETSLVPLPSGTKTGNEIGFAQFAPDLPGTRQIQLAAGSTVLASRLVSATSPNLSLAPPVIDPVTQTVDLQWSATDPDGDPLLFVIQYSADNGQSWRVIQPNYPYTAISLNLRTLAGSDTARLRVMATDGFHTTLGVSEPFRVPRHAPEILLGGVGEGQRVPFGSSLRLTGFALDAEDGSIPRSNLRWELAGPTSTAAVGDSLSLADLPGGSYTATLIAGDSHDQFGTNAVRFEVLPLTVPETSVPILDGLTADEAYAEAPTVSVRLADRLVTVRLVHAEGHLYLAFGNLPYASGVSRAAVAGVQFDLNASGDATPQTDDIGFFLDQNGVPTEMTGNGSGMNPSLVPRPGFNAVVSRGSGGWNVEMRIGDTLLGGWNHIVGAVFNVTGVIDASTAGSWPPSAVGHQPQTWAPVSFGPPPPLTNRPPVALAGNEQTVNVAEARTVFLNGTDSFDPDGAPLTFSWIQIAGPVVSLANPQSATPSFVVAPEMGPVTLRFRLIVGDGQVSSLPSDVAVVLRAPAMLDVVPGTAGPSRFGESVAGQLVVTNEPGSRFRIEATTNFLHWIRIATNTADSFQRVFFLDPEFQRLPYRFYRASGILSPRTVVYSNSFDEVVGPVWNGSGLIATTPLGGRRFLGQFGAETETLTLTNLPSHTSLKVSFDLFILKSWDGNQGDFGPDRWTLSVRNGSTLIDTTFSNYEPAQGYPGVATDNYPARTAAAENNTLGFSHPNLGIADAVYPLVFYFDHTASGVVLDFRGVNLQDVNDESWGLDNVLIEVIDAR